MKCDVIDNNHYLVKVYNDYLDFDIYDHNEIKSFIEKLYSEILKKYNIKGFLTFNIYIDNMYGMIIEIEKNNDFILKNLVDIKINFNLTISFLYEVDYFYLLENKINNQNIYYYKDKYYLEIIKEMEKKTYLNLLDNSFIIYDDAINNIINNGIKLSNISIL